mmetsp:Transcript_2047/g.4712  ORF Transcript_2047/g.4712 Transcript_2047/m.4712 type:complete len:201 (-) Transcript_2047:872-1474(-)
MTNSSFVLSRGWTMNSGIGLTFWSPGGQILKLLLCCSAEAAAAESSPSMVVSSPPPPPLVTDDVASPAPPEAAGSSLPLLVPPGPVTSIFLMTVGISLNRKSPNPRLTAKSPSTRPPATYPPAARILDSSGWSSGLWSYDNATASPLELYTARESPAFAHRIAVGVIKTAHAVVPESPSSSNALTWSAAARLAASIVALA